MRVQGSCRREKVVRCYANGAAVDSESESASARTAHVVVAVDFEYVDGQTVQDHYWNSEVRIEGFRGEGLSPRRSERDQEDLLSSPIRQQNNRRNQEPSRERIGEDPKAVRQTRDGECVSEMEGQACLL